MPDRRLPRALALAALLLAPLLALAAPSVRAADDEDDPLLGLSGARALELATALAADGMQGRKTGFDGGRMAEAWVQSKMGEFGLDPMDRDGLYLHAFQFGATGVRAPIGLSIDGAVAAYRDDFVELLYSGDGIAEGEVVFVGYGIVAPKKGVDDYDGVDVKGKIVLAIRGAPAARETEFGEERQIGWKTSLAAERGAAGVLLVDGDTPVPGTVQERFFRPGLPGAWISARTANVLLAKQGRTLASLRKARDDGDPGKSFGTGVTARLEVHGVFEPRAQGSDALGGFHGKDPDLRREVIVVGAHMDHLGVDPTGAVFNGADDNASGTATLLMLAETLGRNGWRPKRTVVFCAFGGEEQGLVGSNRLVEAPPFAHDVIVAMINLDMTGQGDAAVSLGGREAYPAEFARCLGFLPEALRATVTPFRCDPNSDHWPFYERGIPAFFAHSSGAHPNYHQVTDDAANLKPECMEAVARVVGKILVGLGEHPEPLHTGRELPGLLLREGPRTVDGAASAEALEAWLARPKAPKDDAEAMRTSGWSCVVADLTDGADLLVRFARLAKGVADHAPDVVFVRGAPDVANSARGGRLAVLPRLACGTTAAAFPDVLGTYRKLGIRWVDPFDSKKPLDAAARDRVLATAAAAGLLVDLTSLPEAERATARATLKDAPATLRYAPAAAPTPEALTALRTALGPHTVLLVSGPAVEAVLSPGALAQPDAPELAPVAIVEEATDRLEAMLGACTGNEALALADPHSAGRAAARRLLGSALVDALRRLP